MTSLLLAAEPKGVPVILVIGAIIVLVWCVFGRQRRWRSRDAYCGPGSWLGWVFVPFGVLMVMAALGAPLVLWTSYSTHRHPKAVRVGDQIVVSDDDGVVIANTNVPPPTPNPPFQVPSLVIDDKGVRISPPAVAPPVIPSPVATPPAESTWQPKTTEVAAVDSQAREADLAAKNDTTPNSDAPAKRDAAADSKARPIWVDAMPGKMDGVYRARAASGPWSTEGECEKALNQELRRVVDQYLGDLRNDGINLDSEISLAYIKKNIVKETWWEHVDSPSVGPMLQLHARLEFTPAVQQELQDRWRAAVVAERLQRTGGAAVLLLAALATAFGLLKADAYTQGQYRWRLGLGAGVIWLAIFAALPLLARM